MQLTDEIFRHIARYHVEQQEKLLSITINAWVEMTEKENKLIKVTVDLQRPNFKIFFFFAHNIAKTTI